MGLDARFENRQDVRHEPRGGLSKPRLRGESFMGRDDQAVLSITEAAQFMGVSANSMKRAIARGDIPFIRLGVRVLVPRRGLENYIERGLAGSGGNLATAQK
jgi:excisionase family DNA binding protein